MENLERFRGIIDSVLDAAGVPDDGPDIASEILGAIADDVLEGASDEDVERDARRMEAMGLEGPVELLRALVEARADAGADGEDEGAGDGAEEEEAA